VPSSAGEAGFARFAFPPNDLGHCGPPGAELLLERGAAGLDDPQVRARAPLFDGAWPYLRLLAETAGVEDPLDPDVVSAYWLGGTLLDKVTPTALTDAVELSFGRQPGVRERLASTPDVTASGASHIFHVFVVYPWVGLLGSSSDVPRSVLDSCRVRWGTVESVDGESAEVRSRRLSWDGSALGLAPEQLESCTWIRDQHAFVRDLRTGDQVALHWSWVCERLSDEQVADLAGRTQRQLDSTNSWLASR
jgi:hypothetical protein